MRRSVLLAPRALLALALFAVVWFGTLDNRRLFNPDEGRYAEIPREMLASGDWTTPRLNDFKYFYKPPLQYWMTASAFAAFGEHHWTARLWSALTGFAGILFTAFATGRLFGARAGLIAGAVLGSSLLWNLIGHINTLDMGVSAFLAASVFAVCLAEAAPAGSRESRRWRDGAWVFLALAILSKGLIGAALPAGAVLLYALVQRDPALILRMRPLRGMLIVLAITAPWFVAVSLANPEFAHFFFIHEHVERFLSRVHGRYAPPWYFLPVLAAGLLPWIASLPGAMRLGMAANGTGFQPQRFLLLWAVLVFAFFSASSSKLSAYILPIFPALAALLGAALAKRIAAGGLRAHLLPVPLIALAAFALLGLVPRFAGDDPVSRAGYASYLPFLRAACLFLFVAGAAGVALARRHALAALLIAAAGAHLAGQAVLLGHDKVGFLKSGHDVAMPIRDKVPPHVPFYSVDTYDQSFQFYLRRTTTMVSYQDELAFGIAREPRKFIASLPEFEQAWRGHDEAWALLPPDLYERYRQQGLPMTEMARDSRRVVVKKP